MRNQQGVVLVIALIALVAMSLAGISLMRTVDTTNMISGNLAFGEAAVQMEDVGEEAAYKWIVSNPFSNLGSCQQVSSACPNYYSPDASTMDAATKLPCYLVGDGTLNAGSCVAGTPKISWSTAASTGMPSGYSVQYIIERMCGTLVGGASNTAPGGSANPPTFANCMASPVYAGVTVSLSGGGVGSVVVTAGGSGYATPPTVTFSGGGGAGATGTAVISNGAVVAVTITAPGTGYTSPPTVSFSGGGGTGAGVPKIAPGKGRLFFRVTVRVNGPRNTSGLAQYFIGMEDMVN